MDRGRVARPGANAGILIVAADGAGAARLPEVAEIRPLVDVERDTLAQALAASANNVARAALALGVSRATLYRKLKRHGLSAPTGRGTVPK